MKLTDREMLPESVAEEESCLSKALVEDDEGIRTRIHLRSATPGSHERDLQEPDSRAPIC